MKNNSATLAFIAACSLFNFAYASPPEITNEAQESQIFAHLAAASKLNIATPRLVVVGSESSAKSAILTRLTGVSLPVGSGTTTRCAIQLRTEPSDKFEGTVYTLTSDKGVPNAFRFGSAETPEELSQMIRQAHHKLTGGRFSKDEVHVEVKGPGLKNLIVVDTPGITPNGNDAKFVEEIAKDKLSGSHVIGVGIMSCGGGDLEAQAGLKFIQNKGKNAIGILSKPDRCSATDMENINLMFDGRGFVGPTWFSLQTLFKDLPQNNRKLEAETVIEKKTFQNDVFKSIYDAKPSQFGLINVLDEMKSKIINSYYSNAPQMIRELKQKEAEWDSQLKETIETSPLRDLLSAVEDKIQQAMGTSMKADKDIVSISSDIRQAGMDISQKMRELNPLYVILKECMQEKDKATAGAIPNKGSNDDDDEDITKKKKGSFLKGIFSRKKKQEEEEEEEIDDDDMSTEFCPGNIVEKYIKERDALAKLMNENAGRADLTNDFSGVVSQKLREIANHWEEATKKYKDKIVELGEDATKKVIENVLKAQTADEPTQLYLRRAGDIAINNIKTLVDNNFKYLVKLETEQFYINADDSEFSFLLEAYAAAVRKYLEHNTELADKVLEEIKMKRIDAEGDCGILVVPEIRDAMCKHVASKIDTDDDKNKDAKKSLHSKKAAAKSTKGLEQTVGSPLEKPIDLFVRVSAYVHIATNRFMDNLVTMVNNIMFDRLHVEFSVTASFSNEAKGVLSLTNQANLERKSRMSDSSHQARNLIKEIGLVTGASV